MRLYQNFLGGRLDVLLGAVDTTMSSPGLVAMREVATGDEMYLVLDPDGLVSDPEVVKVTAHGLGAGTATITRPIGAREHKVGVHWIHGALASDMPAMSIDRASDFSDVMGPDLGFDCEFNRSDASTAPTGWSWVNQGAATYLERFGVGSIALGSAAGNNMIGFSRTAPGTATWMATAKVRASGVGGSNGPYVGIAVRDSVSGKFVTMVHSGGTDNIQVDNYSNPTTYGGSSPVPSVRFPNRSVAGGWFVAVRKNSATSFDFLASADGISWLPVLLAHNPTTYLGTAPTDIMLCGMPYGSTAHATFEWFRIR